MNRLPVMHRFFIIGLSICVISLPAYLILFGKKNEQAVILNVLIQKTPTLNALSPRFFSDYLGLCPNGRPLLLKKLDQLKIQKKLQEFPVFKTIQSELTHGGELIVSYELRKPLYILKDYDNLGLDQEGVIIPITPYYSPKKLPEVYLGLDKVTWNKKHKIEYAHQIVSYFNKYRLDIFNIKLIDLSLLDHAIPAYREVVLTVEVFGHSHYLRINPQHVEKALDRYIRLFKEAKLMGQLQKPVIFDARILKFAVLKNFQNKP